MNSRGPSFQTVMPWTAAVKWLIIANGVIFLLFQLIVEKLILHQTFSLVYFGLIPLVVIEKFFVWQPFTYMFLHATDNVTHLLFNMLMLWMTGSELEARWGTRFFTLYYFVCGVGAAVLYVLTLVIYGLITGSTAGWVTPVVGASGAIFGLLLAYGIIFGERTVLFMMMFPMKAKYFVMILGGVLVINMLNDGLAGGGVAHLAHLGGAVSGFCFLRFYTWYQQREWKRRGEPRSGRRLKLVVDNERKDQKSDQDNGGPRYWN